MTTSAAPALTAAASSAALPGPMKVAASGASRDCSTRFATSAPALAASSASSSSDSSLPAGPQRAEEERDFHSSPTRMARSREGLVVGVCYASDSVWTGTVGAPLAVPLETAAGGVPL